MNSLVPDKYLHEQKSLNLAPIVDFLFILLAVFALLLFTESIFYSDEKRTVFPVKNELGTQVLLTINEKGQYEWITEFNEFLLGDAHAMIAELQKQQRLGLLPKDKNEVKVLLEIHQSTKWHEVAKALFTIKEAGFSASPVYSAEN